MTRPAQQRETRQRRTAALAAALVLASSGALIAGWLTITRPEPAHAEPPPVKPVAATETDARAKADKLGKKVEVTAFRGERREVYANPDGTMTAIEYTQPVRTRRDGAWVKIDPTLTRRSDGTIAPVATTVRMAFSGGGNAPLARVAKAGRSFSLDWKGRLPKPVLDGATATYRDVLPDVDLVVTASVDGFSHVLVVKTAKAAANAALARIDMPVTVHGAELRRNGAGGLKVVDSSGGGVIMSASPPRMWDSSGRVRGAASPTVEGAARAKVGVAVKSKSLTLTPDPSLLTGAETVYPVYIDPVWRDEYPPTGWTMVDSGYGSQEYWKFRGNADEGLGLCPATTTSTPCNSSRVRRLMYKVSTSFYKNKDILSAEFGVTLRHTWATDGDPADRVDLYLMNGGISESTNWNNKPTSTYLTHEEPGVPSKGDCSYAGGHATEWNVKSTVQNAANAEKGSLTFGLRNYHENDERKWMRYCPNGHLRVNYNTPPSQPDMDNLGMDPGGDCLYDLVPGKNYVNKLPTLTAVLFDKDHGAKNEWGGGAGQTVVEPLKAQFQLIWGPNETEYTLPLTGVGYSRREGREFTVDLQDMVDQGKIPNPPLDTPIGWIVRGTDGVLDSNNNPVFGPWSWDGSNATRCRFVIDPNRPVAPTVESSDFPNDGSLIDGVGEYGTLTLLGRTDVTWFEYDFSTDEELPGRVDAVPAGGTETTPPTHTEATVRFMPDREGPVKLTVTAIDAANNPSGATMRIFILRISKPAGSWLLSDAAGSSQAVNETGTNHAAAGAGVTFGGTGPENKGPGSNTVANFDGTADAYLSAPARDVVNTGGWFAVAVWARLDDRDSDHTAVSVNGLREAGFVLGYDAATGKWVFEIPDYDIARFGAWRVTGGVVPEDPNDWTHLVGAYNAETSDMQLWVNGTLVASGKRASAWSATGAVQIGRSYDNGRYRNNWSGWLAEVKVYNRMIFDEEVNALRYLAPERAAYWQLNGENDDRTTGGIGEDGTAGPALTLSGDACIYHADPTRPGDVCAYDPDDPLAEQPLMGAGDLRLNSDADPMTPEDGCVVTAANVVDTRDSFTLTARVRLPAAPARSMTVWSLPGAVQIGGVNTNTNLLVLRYLHPDSAWQVSVAYPNTDGTALSTTTVLHTDTSQVTEGVGQLVAVSYNSYTDEVTLYADGTPVTVRVPFLNAWQATGGLQIGRHLSATGTGQDYFSGLIDDFRVYKGVLSRDTVQYLGADLTEQPDL